MTKEEYKEQIKKIFSDFLDEIDNLNDEHIKDFHSRLDDFMGGCLYNSRSEKFPKTEIEMCKISKELGVFYPHNKELEEEIAKSSESEEKEDISIPWMKPEMKALINELPGEGPTKNLKLELVRAFNKIVWDFYNNGWGNNWACPMFLLSVTECDDGNFPIEYSFGIPYDGPKERIEKSLERLQDWILKVISNHPEYENITGVNMWNKSTFNRIPENNYKYFFNPGFTDIVESFADIDKEIIKKALENNRDLMCRYPTDSFGYSNLKELLNYLNEVFEGDTEFIDWYMNFYTSLPKDDAVVS